MSISPPRPKGPPLNALRAFEAAARHVSFLLASRELCVTAGAVAQQIKQLEAWAGCPLFERHAHGVVLTSVGRDVAAEFTAAFDSLGAAVQRLRRATAPSELGIAALPSVAQLWLLPRLPALRKAFPQLTVSIAAMEEPPNLAREPYDLAFFFGRPPTIDEAGSRIVARSSCFPVCAPAIAKRLRSPADVIDEALLHDATWRSLWDRWLAKNGVSTPCASKGPVFSLYSLAVEEAKNGAGILMGRQPLVAAHLKSGALVRPFDSEIDDDVALIVHARPDRDESVIEQQVLRCLLDGRKWRSRPQHQ